LLERYNWAVGENKSFLREKAKNYPCLPVSKDEVSPLFVCRKKRELLTIKIMFIVNQNKRKNYG